ncbi:MAG: hypothetical protein AAGM38_13275 [Pseudomonadota bacterium]
MTDDEKRRFDADLDQMRATTAKLNAETAKLISENRWYPFVVGSGVTLAIVAVVKIFL